MQQALGIKPGGNWCRAQAGALQVGEGAPSPSFARPLGEALGQ